MAIVVLTQILLIDWLMLSQAVPVSVCVPALLGGGVPRPLAPDGTNAAYLDKN